MGSVVAASGLIALRMCGILVFQPGLKLESSTLAGGFKPLDHQGSPQKFCFVLFCDFYVFVKPFILFVYCFPDFTELSFCVFLKLTKFP